jgi:uncharacterized Fe-S cluster protein YjdI
LKAVNLTSQQYVKMSLEILHYSANGVTIQWEPKKCIHSGICVKGLPAVFDARRKPWIIPENASPEQVINQVHRCPSGALSIVNDPAKEIDGSVNA